MEISGKLKMISDTQQVSASFRKREFAITTDEQYPQHILIELTQDKCDLMDNYREGQDVKVSINLRGREWISPEGLSRYFNTIQAWRIERAQGGAQEPAAQQPANNQNYEQHDDNPLPF